MSHGVEIFDILSSFYSHECDVSMISSILFRLFENIEEKKRIYIRKKFGDSVYSMLYKIDKMNIIDKHVTENRNVSNADGIIRMIVSMSNDIRIVFIKLSERLHVIRKLHESDTEDVTLAEHVMNVYVKLAGRLGISKIKCEMEDIAFKMLNREKYSEICQYLNQTKEERDTYIENMIRTIDILIRSHGLDNFIINGRAKNICSIYRKMQRKHIPVYEIYDTNAIRIIVDSISQCYEVLEIIRKRWNIIEKEFDDYISQPKINGYQSIHIVIINNIDNRNIEIQMRTKDMHMYAESGIAAHWAYKENISDRMSILNNFIDWHNDISDIALLNKIYVFTPKSDIVDLNVGATPVDFAYRIHSEIGNRCIGVKINDRIAQLSRELSTGDTVSIITSKNAKPSRDWLCYVKTSKAKSKIKKWFNVYDNNK